MTHREPQTQHDRTHTIAIARARRGALVLLPILLLACNRSRAQTAADCREDPVDDVEMAARTSGQAVETGAKTAWEGAKAAGRSSAALVTDGEEEAGREWDTGKSDTRRVARSESSDVEREANVPRCPDR